MKEIEGPQTTRELPSIAPNTKVADILEAYPRSLDALVALGFDNLRSVIARKTVAKMVTLQQAASLRGIDLDVMLATLKRAAGLENYEEDTLAVIDKAALGAKAVPDLQGDIRFLGLVPCPIRNVLTEKFDAFAQKLTTLTGSTIAWWMAGEGTGTKDVKNWLSSQIEARDFERIPDIVLGVGNEIFFHQKYGRTLYDQGIWTPFHISHTPRPELHALEDPKGTLALLFTVLFTFSCRPARLPSGSLPKTWTDLAKPEFSGQIAFPSLDLPIMPDLLGALHHHLGEVQFAQLASNIHVAFHPSQSSPRSKVEDVPGVVVLPLHFAEIATSTGAIHVIPEDGPVAVPAYLAMKSSLKQEADSVTQYLTSSDFLEPFWSLGHFLPNRSDIQIDMPIDHLVTRPWETILMEAPETLTNRLITMVSTGGVS